MKEKIKKNMKAGGLLSVTAIGVIIAIIAFANIGDETFTEQRVWVKDIPLYAVGDADPGAGASGWLNMTVYANASNAATYYARNLTNNESSYAWTNVNNTHAGSNVPYNTALALWYKIRVNVSDGYSAGNSTWMPTWVRCNVTCAGLSLSDAGMDRYVIGDNATYMWLAFVYNDGITISMGQNVTDCEFYVDMYQ